MPDGPVWLYVGSVVIVLVALWLWRTGRSEAEAVERSRRLALADERRARAQLNGRAPLETRASQRTPPRLPPR